MAIFDPIPDPTQCSWTPEGTGCTFQPGTQLTINDPSTAGDVYLTFVATDATIFGQDIALTPRVELTPGWVPAADTNIGFHVTIHDGTNMIRAVLLDNGDTVSVSVALVSPNSQTGYSPPLPFNAALADFALTRKADGSAVLTVANKVQGQPPITFTMGVTDLPSSDRPGVKAIEFGTLKNVAASGISGWSTLGLPLKPNTVPIGLNIKQVRVRDDDNAALRTRLVFSVPTGAAFDPVANGANLTFANATGQFYPPAGATIMPIQPGEFVFKPAENPKKWVLTDAAKARTGIERFEFLQADGSMFFVDRNTPRCPTRASLR
jgi:hypothetical protein